MSSLRILIGILVAIPLYLSATPIVTVDDVPLRDKVRERVVDVKIYYPQLESRGGYPVVIFSHGAELTKDDYGYLGRFLAENGYVVIHPTHVDDGAIYIKNGKLLVSGSWVPYTKEREDQVVIGPSLNRPQDISFVVDSLKELAQKIPDLGGRMDLNRIGLAGHSAGASTVVTIAGGVIRLKGVERSFKDPRVSVFIAMSLFPPEAAKDWACVTQPVLVVNGSKEMESVHNAFGFLPMGAKYCVTVRNVGHQDFFGDRVADRPAHDFISRVSLAYLNVELRDRSSMDMFPAELRKLGISQADGLLIEKGVTGRFESR